MQLYWLLRLLRYTLLNKQEFVRIGQSKIKVPLDSPTSIAGSINRKSLNHLNGKLRTKEKQEWEVSHNLALKRFRTFLKFEDRSQFVVLSPLTAFTTAFQLQASFQCMLPPRHSRLQIYISIGLGYTEFQNQHVIGTIVFYASQRATFMPSSALLCHGLPPFFFKLDWDQCSCFGNLHKH